ncbi:MAG: BatD family protein [Deltaproteobacteria bacterium]|nr:BatD family protein [Deltaproteobacteria bacterium]
MVRSLFILLSLLAARAELLPPFEILRGGPPSVRLTLEFSKPSIMRGEPVTAGFYLTSSRPFEEIEVSRFPEFDGFWTENTALRQGRLILSPFGKNRYRVLVGAYTITPVATRDNPRIDPMHLIVKGLEKPLLSEGNLLPIRPLPQHPSGTVAVGQLTLNTDSQLSFYPDQPMTLRVLVQGEGNFPEFEAPHLVFPSSVELASQHATILGSGSFATKTFEYTFVAHTQLKQDIPQTHFWYFNTKHGKYESLPIGPISLMPVNSAPPELTVQTSTPRAGQSITSVFRNPFVILVNVLFLVFLAFLGLRSPIRRISMARPARPTPLEERAASSDVAAAPDWRKLANESVSRNDAGEAYRMLAAWIRSLLENSQDAGQASALKQTLRRCEEALYARLSSGEKPSPLEIRNEIETAINGTSAPRKRHPHPKA